MARARAIPPFFPTAWVFLPDPAAAGHTIFASQYPLTISEVMKSIKNSSTMLINRGRAAWGELRQGRFFIVAPDPQKGVNTRYMALAAFAFSANGFLDIGVDLPLCEIPQWK
jgi:hypothetical protein